MRKVLLLLLPLLLTTQAYAGSVTLNLKRQTLTNVNDSAGRWQHEGGQLFKGGTQVGNYALTRRVTNGGTTAQNTAMLTITLFFFPDTPPQNVTLQGAHSFNTGLSRGSVSAASVKYNWVRDASFMGDASKGILLIEWLGSSTLTIP